jgi:hypothetical protein
MSYPFTSARSQAGRNLCRWQVHWPEALWADLRPFPTCSVRPATTLESVVAKDDDLILKPISCAPMVQLDAIR